MSDLSDLELLIASRTPIIGILSHEEDRVVALVLRVAKRRYLPVFRFAVTEGVRRLDGEHPAQRMYLKPADAPAYFRSLSTGAVLLLLDFHRYLELEAGRAQPIFPRRPRSQVPESSERVL